MYGFICFLFLYFLKHNISSEENDDTTHQDRVIPNIIYSLQYYRADCEFWWCACIFIVLLNPAKLDQILRNHIPTERRQPLLCVCTLICMTMRMFQWVVNGIAMPLNVIWFFLYMRFPFPRYRCKLYGYLHCLQALKLPKFSSSFQQHPFEVFLLETLIFFSKGNQLIGMIRRIHFVLKKIEFIIPIHEMTGLLKGSAKLYETTF